MNNPAPFWPVIDRQHRHIRTPDAATVIPFHIIQTLACITAVLIGIEATYGLTNWITIPTALAAMAWAIERCDHATATTTTTNTTRTSHDPPPKSPSPRRHRPNQYRQL